MPTADLVDEKWIQIDNLKYRDRDAAHELPGYSYKNGKTRCAVSWPALKILIDLFPDDLVISDALSEWAWDESNNRVQPAVESHDWAMNPENECSDEFFELLKECNLA